MLSEGLWYTCVRLMAEYVCMWTRNWISLMYMWDWIEDVEICVCRRVIRMWRAICGNSCYFKFVWMRVDLKWLNGFKRILLQKNTYTLQNVQTVIQHNSIYIFFFLISWAKNCSWSFYNYLVSIFFFFTIWWLVKMVTI